MENATQALLMAFAVLIFVIALTVTFTSLAQAKSTADIVLHYSDRENFQEKISRVDSDADKVGGRLVKIDTVVATLKRCIRENFAVKITMANGKSYVFDYGIQTKKGIENKISDFIKNNNTNNNNFLETYVEVTLNGQTYTGSDGTTLEQNVGKKIYITYKESEV